MAWPLSSLSVSVVLLLVVSLLLLLGSVPERCHGLSSFGFDIHHRFSDPVKGILQGELPDKGTREYYVAMAHRDRIFRGRRLAAGDGGDDPLPPLTFVPNNETYQIGSFGL